MDKKEKMFRLISQWEKSGISVSEFARRHDIGLHSFNYFRKQYQLEQQQENSPVFVELKSATSAKTPAMQMEIDLPGGIHIRIY
jgi:transposase-like protein